MWALQDEFDDFLGDIVGEAEIGAGDRDEPEHDGRGLKHMATIRPLDALQLGPAGAQKPDRAIAFAQGRTRRTLGADVAGPTATATPGATTAPAARRTAGLLQFVLAEIALRLFLDLDLFLGQ